MSCWCAAGDTLLAPQTTRSPRLLIATAAHRGPYLRIRFGSSEAARKPAFGGNIFVERLGQLFMPFTVQMQRQYGLTAYLPAVLPESKESTIPDEVALVFYRTQECYHEAKRSVGGRAYSELHELVFDMPASRSGFPKLLAADEITPDQPYHLFERLH